MARDHLYRGQPGSPGCMHTCGLSAWRARAARQSHSSLLTFLSFPRFPSNSDLHHLAWVHQLCYRLDPVQAVVIRCSAQLLMFLSLSLLTLPVVPMTLNSTTSGGEALCLLTSRLSWGYTWTMLYRPGLLQQLYRSLVLAVVMSNSSRSVQGKGAYTAHRSLEIAHWYSKLPGQGSCWSRSVPCCVFSGAAVGLPAFSALQRVPLVLPLELTSPKEQILQIVLLVEEF